MRAYLSRGRANGIVMGLSHVTTRKTVSRGDEVERVEPPGSTVAYLSERWGLGADT
jgi:hypothetical protein